MSRNLSNLYISESFQYLVQESGSFLQTGLGSNLTGSLLITASLADTATSASYATTASYAETTAPITTIYETIYAGENLVKTDPVYLSGSVGANPVAYKADAGDAAKSPAVYIANDTINAGSTGQAIALGLIEGINLTGYDAGQEVYLGVGGGWTATRPTGSAAIQVLGIVTKGGSGGKGFVFNAGEATLPNLTAGYAWVGNANGIPTAVATSSFSTTVNTGSLLTTASFSDAQITFTKGDGSTFNGVINNVTSSISASHAEFAVTASYATFASGAVDVNGIYTASAVLNTITFEKGDTSTFTVTIDTGSYNPNALITASVADATISFLKQGGGTFDVTVNNVVNADSASVATTADTATSASYAVTASYAENAGTTVDTGSLLTTASFSDATITFTKGDGSTFDGVINNVTSSISASYATTADTATSASYATSASLASLANQVKVSTASNSFLYQVPFVANDGNETVWVDSESTKLTYVPATNTLGGIDVLNATKIVATSVTASLNGNATTATSASYAATSSYATDFTVAGTITATSASIEYLTTIYETASVIYSSGSNQFGDASDDTQTLYGTVDILTGPLNVSGSATFHNGITGSLDGTATSASYATSASQAENATTAASATSASYALTASYAENAAGGAAFPYTGSAEITGSLGITGSFAQGNNVYTNGNPTYAVVGGTGSYVSDPTGYTEAAAVIGAHNSYIVSGSANPPTSTRKGFAIVGGYDNSIQVRVNANNNNIFGGQASSITSVYGRNTIVGAANSTITGNSNNIMLGGEQNQMNVDNGIVIGGLYNQHNGGAFSVVSGYNNRQQAGDVSFMAGGESNYNYGARSFMGAGGGNTINSNGRDNAIIGGSSNNISGSITGSVVLGGTNITGSENYTVYVPNLTVTGSITGSVISADPGDNTVVLGTSITQRGTSNNVQIGYSADVGSGVDYATVIGSGANGASSNDVAIGADASTGGGNSIAIGSNATATSLLSMAIGQASQATDVGAVTIGLNSRAANDSVTVGGGGSTDSGQIQCVTLGNTTTSTAAGQVTIGREAVGGSGATNAVTIGKFATTQANHSQSVAIGYNVTSSAAGGVNINDVFVYNPITTTNNTVVTNLADTYATPKVNSVVTLTQAEYNAIGTPDDGTLYVISGSTPFNASDFATTGSNNFTGQITGDVTALTPSSNTASLDCSTGNFFTLTLSDGSNTLLEASNVTAGQTINLQVTNGGAGTGTISFGTGILQPTGSLYTGSAASSAIDVVSMISFDGATLLMNSVKQFV